MCKVMDWQVEKGCYCNYLYLYTQVLLAQSSGVTKIRDGTGWDGTVPNTKLRDGTWHENL